METVTELLDELTSRGVKLSSVAGQLKCHAPKGALTPQLQAGIVRYKAEILALLGGANGEQPAAPAAERAPAMAKEFPLSAGQKGLYILQSLNPGMGAYNLPVCFRIDGAVDAQLWRKPGAPCSISSPC